MTKYAAKAVTRSQYNAAMAMYAPTNVGRAGINVDVEYQRMMAPEAQDEMTRDSLRAMAEATAKKKTRDAEYAAPADAKPVAVDNTWARDEQRQLTGDLAQFVLGGNATFTVVSKKTGARFTFKVRAAKGDGDNLPHFVTVLTGSDNEQDYSFLGTIFADGNYRHGRKSVIGQTAPSACAFQWLWQHIEDPALSDKVEFWHEGRCCRCGRKLTVPSSIEAGIGPECAGK